MSKPMIGTIVCTDSTIHLQPLEGEAVLISKKKDSSKYKILKQAIKDKKTFEEMYTIATPENHLEASSKGKLTKKEDGEVYYKGQRVSFKCKEKVQEFLSDKINMDCMAKFWERLLKSPSQIVRDHLFDFLQHGKCPILPDGRFVGVRGINAATFKDNHSGTMDNSPGQSPSLEWSEVDLDPRVSCSRGIHVGTMSYVSSMYSNSAHVLVIVDPADVGCVPYDYNSNKMRTRGVYVLGVLKDMSIFDKIGPTCTIEDLESYCSVFVNPNKNAKCSRYKKVQNAAKKLQDRPMPRRDSKGRFITAETPSLPHRDSKGRFLPSKKKSK